MLPIRRRGVLLLAVLTACARRDDGMGALRKGVSHVQKGNSR